MKSPLDKKTYLKSNFTRPYRLHKDVFRFYSNSCNCIAIFCAISLFQYLCLVVSLRRYPLFSLYILSGFFIVASLVFTVDMWIIYIFLNGNYIENPHLTAVTARSPAEPGLIEYVKKKITSSILFSGRNRRIKKKSFQNSSLDNLKIYTYSTSHLFSILTIDGLPDLTVFFTSMTFFTVLAWVLTLVMLSNYKKFFCIMKLFKKLSDVAFSMPYLFFHSAITFVSLTLVWIYCFGVIILLSSSNKPEIDKRGFVNYTFENSNLTRSAIVATFFLSLWIWFFVSAGSEYCFAHVVTTYIFHRSRFGNSSSPNKYSLTLTPIFELVRYHLGTITFASVAVTFCKFNKLFLRFIRSILINFFQGKYKCVDLCLNKLEFCLKQVNRNATICAVLYGHDFKESAKYGYNLLNNNSVRLLKTTSTIYLFTMTIKFSLILSSLVIIFCYFGLLLLPHHIPFEFPSIPWYVCLFSLNLAQSCFTVFGSVLDTLIICYFDDLARNNGADKRYYIEPDIQKWITTFLFKEITTVKKSKVAPETIHKQSVDLPKTKQNFSRLTTINTQNLIKEINNNNENTNF